MGWKTIPNIWGWEVYFIHGRTFDNGRLRVQLKKPMNVTNSFPKILLNKKLFDSFQNL